MDGITPVTPRSNITVTAQDRLLLACPCLNVKLHLAQEQNTSSSITGQALQLGLAGVSVEQKILAALTISNGQAKLQCVNCRQDVYTFPHNSNSVNLDSTSLAYIPATVLYSPSNGLITPCESVIGGPAIALAVRDPHYSKAFRLVLTPADQSSPSLTYQPHLERVRSILDKELEANLSAQRQQTTAKIEAYKSQQLLALEQSIGNTKLEKDRLWTKIQERVPPPPLGETAYGVVSTPGQDGSLDMSAHPFDGPSTLPIRLTSASRVDGPLGSFVDRRASSNADMAMSLQFRQFDQRLASNSLRRQSLAPLPTENTTEGVASASTSNNRTPMSTSHASANSIASHDTAGSSETPTLKPKKRVTIADTVDTVSIIEPEQHESAESTGFGNDYDEDLGAQEEEGVVFDLDEELGFGEEDKDNHSDEDQDSDDNLSDDGQEAKEDDNSRSSTGAVNISSSMSKSLPRPGMMSSSLRANYLRRQRGLEEHRRALDEDDFEVDSDSESDGTNDEPVAAVFGTSLPIQIQGRQSNISRAARTSVIASPLALPPGSSPAAAMLQRRLSRAYGPEIAAEAPTRTSSQLAPPHAVAATGSMKDGRRGSFATGSIAAGSLIIDPLMLMEEAHDADDRRDRAKKHRQPFSSINHRRDLEQGDVQEQPTLVRSTQDEFEPPHLFSARTYVGDTPWEMPTRVTVQSGGMEREGSHLDKQIALEMAQELEKERQERAEENLHVSQRVHERIEEGEEEVDEEDTNRKIQVAAASNGVETEEGSLG